VISLDGKYYFCRRKVFLPGRLFPQKKNTFFIIWQKFGNSGAPRRILTVSVRTTTCPICNLGSLVFSVSNKLNHAINFDRWLKGRRYIYWTFCYTTLLCSATCHTALYVHWELHIYRVRQKSIPLKNFANFSRTIERYDIKCNTFVTLSNIRKCGKFHYIIYRNDKIMLLLVMIT